MGAFLCILCGIFLRPMYRMVIFWGDVKIEYMYCLGMPDIHNIIYFIFLGGGGGVVNIIYVERDQTYLTKTIESTPPPPPPPTWDGTMLEISNDKCGTLLNRL